MEDKEKEIAAIRNAIADCEIALDDTENLFKQLDGCNSLKKSITELEDKIAAEIFERVPADKRAEIQLAWDASSEKFTIDAVIPVRLHIARGGRDWVDRYTDHPYFMDDDIENVPFPKHVWEESRSYEAILSDRLDRFNELRYDLKKEYGVDAFDILNDE